MNYFIIWIQCFLLTTCITIFKDTYNMIRELCHVLKYMKCIFFGWLWICAPIVSYFYLSSVYTTAQCTIKSWNHSGVGINISTVYRLWYIAWYFILVGTVLINLINVTITPPPPDLIFLNVIFWKLIPSLLFYLISIYLIRNKSLIWIYIFNNRM